MTWKKSDWRGLIDWYQKNQRELPWRQSQNPYSIWISEVMLQQTTTKAVIPYFERFLKRFPNLKALAESPIEDVLALWSGLGYYSRARNLHKAAQLLQKNGGFPQKADELIQYPGFGPYTSRAVTSIAFQEPVGVLDGNVIRVLSRFWNLKTKWWERPNRDALQELSDQFAQMGQSQHTNQALMELGATICTPQNPTCVVCPWFQSCSARKNRTTKLLPLLRPRRKFEKYIWQPEISIHKGRVLLKPNSYAPFLKKSLIPPGQLVQTKSQPARYDFRHTITHHDIFVQVRISKATIAKGKSSADAKWIPIDKVPEHTPAKLVIRAIEIGAKNFSSSF